MLNTNWLAITQLLATDHEHDQTKLIVYAILILVFLGLTALFGFLYFKLKGDDSPKVKMPHKPIKRYWDENRSKIIGGIAISCIVVIVGVLAMMWPLI